MESTHRSERWPALRIDLSDLAVEVISIVLAILLALAVNAWRDGVTRADAAHRALVAIRTEIEANRARLAPRLDHHHAVLRAISGMQQRANAAHQLRYDTFWATFRAANPQGFEPFVGEETAWNVARSANVLPDVPNAVLQSLEGLYARQDNVSAYLGRIIADLHLVPTQGDNVFYGSAGFVIDAGDLAGNEQDLLKRYDAALAQLASAGVRS